MKMAAYALFNVVWVALIYFWRWKMVIAEEREGHRASWMLGWARPVTADGIRYRKYSRVSFIGGLVAYLVIFPGL